MSSTRIIIGVLSPSQENREMFRSQLNASGLALVSVEASQYCLAYGDRPTRDFIEARPEIILIDMEDPKAAIQSLQILHAALPETWLFLSPEPKDSQLIIEAVRVGAREFLTCPLDHRQLSQSLGRYISDRQRRSEGRQLGRIHCVTAAKGGVGATTLAINVAASLATETGHVALIDMYGVAGDIAAQLDLKPQFTVYDALEASSRLDSVLIESYMSPAHGMAVLPGAKDFRPGVRIGSDALSSLLEVLARTYTNTIIDLSSSIEKDLFKLVTEMAASMVVVATPELPALWRTERLLRYMEVCGGDEKIRLVMNRSSKSDEISDNEIEKALKHSVYWKVPNNYKRSIRAINSGMPLVSANNSDLAHSCKELAFRLAGIVAPKKTTGMLKLFSS
jgi:pilus assembly protein CpaE